MRMQARINTETATIGALQKPAARLKIATFSGEKPARMKCQNCMLRTSCLAKTSRASDMEILNDVALHPTPAHKGDYFYHQEDNFKSLFIVRSGAVKTYHVDKQGQEHITGFLPAGRAIWLRWPGQRTPSKLRTGTGHQRHLRNPLPTTGTILSGFTRLAASACTNVIRRLSG